MKICEKVDFLMKLTDTSNSAMGKYLTFDASYISRIRSGKRNLPKDHLFFDKAATFFAEHINNDYQKKILSEFICPGSELPESTVETQKYILNWLSASEEDKKGKIDSMSAGESEIRHSGLQNTDLTSVDKSGENCAGKIRFFYGNE